MATDLGEGLVALKGEEKVPVSEFSSVVMNQYSKYKH